MTIKNPIFETSHYSGMTIAIVVVVILLNILLGLNAWSQLQTRSECGSLPLSAYTNPDDNTPAKCYAMWKDGRL